MSVRLPAEWEPQEATWMAWPTVDPKGGVNSRAAAVALIRALGPANRIRLSVANDAVAQEARQFLGDLAGQVEILATGHREVWMRDCGPTFVHGPNGLTVIRYGFDYWGYGQNFASEADAERQALGADAQALGLPCADVDLVSEGGNRESNGQGVLMLVESVERSRNPGRTRTEIEAAHRQALGVSTFVWLPIGVAEDDPPDLGKGYLTPMTTGGHVDNLARFVSPDTIVLAEVDANATDPLTSENRLRLDRVAAAIRQARDANGRPFRLVRLPLPPPIFDTIDAADAVFRDLSRVIPELRERTSVPVVHAASTLNFVLANDVVVVPSYGRDDRPAVYREVDEKVAEILSGLFPDRRIEFVDPEAWNLGGGGPHCVTAHQPAD